MATHDDHEDRVEPEGPTRFQLYMRLGFGALVAFGVAGSCTGHSTGAALTFVLVSIMWCLQRIIVESFDAYRRLYPPPPPKKQPSTPPPPDDKSQTS